MLFNVILTFYHQLLMFLLTHRGIYTKQSILANNHNEPHHDFDLEIHKNK